MKAGYHGATNGKYKTPGEEGTLAKIAYLKSVSLDPQINSTAQYANNRMVLNIPTDNGYTGELGVTAQDPALETAIGRTMKLANGALATVGGAGTRRLEGLYYEFYEEDETDGRSAVKVWLLGVELGASSVNNSTDQDSVEFGAYSYPVTVYGTRVLKDTGEDEYVDERGLPRQCYMMVSRPDDTGYATFGDSVPEARMAASE